MKCYCLRFKSPFHVDTRGTGFYEQSDHYIQSSTLSAAIVSIWALLAPEEAASWASQPEFKLSSAFPYYQTKDQTYFFLPRPVNSMATVLNDDPEIIQKNFKHIKKINKIKWLESRLWTKVISNPQIEYDNIHIISNIFACHKNMATLMPSRFWEKEEKPRLYTDRFTNQAIKGLIFRFGRIHFEDNCGLYFLATFDNNDARLKFESALTLLGDSGIGSDRNSGNGLFEWEENDQFKPNLIAPKLEASHVCLSLLNPCIKENCKEVSCTEKDCDVSHWLKKSSYQLLTNAGWIGTSGKRKKSVRMFVEGSIFSKKLKGNIIEVGELNGNIKVYRDGRGFFL